MPSRLKRDDENGLAYLYLVEAIAPGQAVTQRTVSLSEDEDDVDLVLDFDADGRLLGVEFLRGPSPARLVGAAPDRCTSSVAGTTGDHLAASSVRL